MYSTIKIFQGKISFKKKINKFIFYAFFLKKKNSYKGKMWIL